jgi:hypothetical protein
MAFTRRIGLLGAGALALGGCSSTPSAPPSPDHGDWRHVGIPGKSASHYREVVKDGRTAFEATAKRSASMWRRRVAVPAAEVGEVSFSWWVSRLLPQASVADASREDAVARVLFGFEGDRSRLSARTRALFELAEVLTGEEPPYATLMYVWETPPTPPETVIVNPRSDRLRKMVLDSGSSQLGRWRDHRRNLAADFQRAFGEPPGDLVSVALMTDADNTGGSAHTWYGPVRWGADVGR